MFELLVYTLKVCGVVGTVCGVIAAIQQRSFALGICVFVGSVLAGTGIVGGLGLLLELIVRLRGSQGGSDSPPAAAQGVGEVLFLLILIPAALTGAALGGVAYQSWRDRQQ